MKNLSEPGISKPPEGLSESANDLKPLSQVLNDLREKGFTVDFRFDGKYMTPLQDPSKSYRHEDLTVVNFFRFEGETDPADEAILYALETADGMKGTIVNAYGVNADVKLDEFLSHRITKK